MPRQVSVNLGLSHIENPLGEISQTVYNVAGRVSATVNPLGYRTTLIYDVAGRRKAVLDAEGNRTTTVYDGAGRAHAAVNALGHSTTLIFDAAGRREALVDANGHRTTFQYDASSNLTKETDPLGRSTTFTYTVLNQQESRLDARGVRTTFSYDQASRLTGKAFSDGTARTTFAYDPTGNRTRMQDVSGTTDYTYNSLNRSVSVDAPWSAPITYSYDPVGQRASMVDPDGGVFTYSYDDANRLHLLDNASGERTTYSYNAAGRTLEELRGNGVKTTRTYDSNGSVKNIIHRESSNQAIANLNYIYDKVGNRTRVENEVNTDTTDYSYDETYRLINEDFESVEGGNSYSTSHTYDSVGNRLFEDTGSERTTFTYDVANQLDTKVDATGANPSHDFTFDGAGNLTRDQTVGVSSRTDYDWNAENQLISVTPFAAGPTEYLYNGNGLRVEIKEGTTPDNRFVWDQNNLLMDKNSAGATQSLYTSNPQLYGNLISQRRSSTSHYHLFDALGSTIGLTNSSQVVTDSYHYKAYGETVSQTGTTVNPFKWVGRVGYYDDQNSGLHYVGLADLVIRAVMPAKSCYS